MKMFLQNFRAVACLQLELHPHLLKAEKLDVSIRPFFANPVTYTYLHTANSSRVPIRTAKLVRCVVRQVTELLFEWLLSTVNPSVDQPPTLFLQII